MRKHFHEVHGLLECNDKDHSSPKQLIKLLKVQGCIRTGNRIIKPFSLTKKIKKILWDDENITLGELLFGTD